MLFLVCFIKLKNNKKEFACMTFFLTNVCCITLN